MRFIDIDYIRSDGYRRTVGINFDQVAAIRLAGPLVGGHVRLILQGIAGESIFEFTAQDYSIGRCCYCALMGALRGDRTAMTLHTFAEAEDSAFKGRE